MSRRAWVASATLAILTAGASPASAQISRVGSIATFAASRNPATSPIKGSDSGYDQVNRVYLVVGGCYGSLCPEGVGPVYGVFVNFQGTEVTGRFSIKPGNGDGGDGHFPRVRYCRDVNNGQGGFLVTYLEEGPQGRHLLKARLVAYPGVVIGSEQTLSDAGSPPWLESGAAIGYSITSKKFLVAWMTSNFSVVPFHLAVRLVDVNGVGSGSAIRLSNSLGRDPSVAWNSATDRFGISFGGENAAGTNGFSKFAIVSPSGVLEAQQTFNNIAGLTMITDTDYNPDTGRFVMTWWQGPLGIGPEVRTAEIDNSANVVSTGLVSRQLAGYNSVSMAFNPVSRTFLLVSLPTSDEVVATELNRNGVRTSAITAVGPGVTARYTRVSSSTHRPDWNVTFTNNYRSANTLVVATTSTGGGPAGQNPPPEGGGGTPAPGPTPPPAACPSVQPAPDWVCVNGGWLPPGMAGVPAPPPPPPPSSPPPASGACPSVQPAPDWVCVNGGWLPPGLAGVPAPPPPAPRPPAPSTCNSPQPGSDWVCVSGNWLPPGLAPAPPPSSSGSCPSAQPAADWVCVSGNWLPPGLAPAGTPPPASPPPSSSCTTVQPAADWICIGGNWLPQAMVCPTVQPGPGWTCRSGNWLPPGMVSNWATDPVRVALPGLTPERHAVVAAERLILDRRTPIGRA